MGDHLQTEAVVAIFISSQIIFSPLPFFLAGVTTYEEDVFLKSYTILDARLQLMWIGQYWYCTRVISHCTHLVH